MRLSLSAAVMAAAAQLTASLASASSTFSTEHTPQRDNEKTTSESPMTRRDLSEFPKNGITPSIAVVNATTTACVNRLLGLNGVAGSPTGMSVCYDVTSLDNTTGEFISNIYLYQVSPATGNWTNIDPTSLNVNIMYPYANLTQSALGRRASIPSPISSPKLQARTSNPVLITSDSFRGKVMMDWSATDQSKQMLTLQPTITVTALTASQPHQPLRNTLSPTEAAFVSGAFTAQAATLAAQAAAAAAATPFVLPGTRMSSQISPAGPILTGIWVFLFAATLGAGTLERLRFRNAYRRKSRFHAWTSGAAAGAVPRAVVGYERF